MLARLTGFLIAFIIVVWVVEAPAAAGNAVHDLIAGLITFASNVGHP